MSQSSTAPTKGEIAMSTLSRQMGNAPIAEATKWAIPFVLCEAVVMLLATFVPVVSMALPNLLK